MNFKKEADEIGGKLWGLGVDSENRAELLLELTHTVCDEVFWHVFQESWPCCDDTWHLKDRLIEALEFHSGTDPQQSMTPEQRRFMKKLYRNDTTKVYRGCSSDRVLGLSWTTDISVATGFARGHRGIPVDNPVIATACIPIRGVFTVFTDRSESEVVLDPRELIDVQISSTAICEKFQPTQNKEDMHVF